jgi:large subunit ribosomal protein L4
MPQVKVYDLKSQESGSLSLKDEVFAAPVKNHLLHDSVLNHLANRRRGTASTKTRAEVSGGGKKPWRQKGTGRARQGSTRAPQWIHGGISFGPKPRSYDYQLSKKVRRASLRSALSVKAGDGSLVILDSFQVTGIKTKTVADFLKSFKVYGQKVLVVVEAMDEKAKLSCRNIEGLELALATSLHPYELLWAEKVFVTQAAVKKIEEGLA